MISHWFQHNWSTHLWQAAPIPSRSWRQPVDDSPCVIKKAFGLTSAILSSISFNVKETPGDPWNQCYFFSYKIFFLVTFNWTMFIPARWAMSVARSPQIPLWAIKTVSPGSQLFISVHSMAAWPVALKINTG